MLDLSPQKLVVANWKMNGSRRFIANWMEKFSPPETSDKHDIVICPSMPYMVYIKSHLPDGIALGGQDIAPYTMDGAYTGYTSASMLRDVGCSHVLIGHSERRQYANENDKICVQKCMAAVSHDLSPIYCIGEPLKVRQSGDPLGFVQKQLEPLMFARVDMNNAAVAYEPIWSIGTGLTPHLDEIETIHNGIREYLIRELGSIGDRIPLLYGGSVNQSNAQSIINITSVDGLLVGGASLKPEEFNQICNLTLTTT